MDSWKKYSIPEHHLVRVAHLGLEGLAVWIRGAGGVLVLDAALYILQPITSIACYQRLSTSDIGHGTSR
jgi:hypothetical protein